MASALKKVRETRHFDLQSVARYAGISSDRLEEFENGKREPSPRQLERLAQTYGLASYLLGSDTIPNLRETVADFRRSIPKPAHLSPAGMARIWSAEEVSEVTAQLMQAISIKPPVWAGSIPTGKLTPKLGGEIRSFFDEWMAARSQKFQFFGTDDQKFFSCFRLFLEVQSSIVRVQAAIELRALRCQQHESENTKEFSPSGGLPVI
jgi:transcriptional regulator with XRE-family HTH domain